MKDNKIGLFFGDSNSSTIYHNNFINNTEQALTMNSQDAWDNGIEGNYWSDYKGQDVDGDAIGDAPYVIDENNRDNYPLVKQKLD